jgi:hypothetical protein
MIQNSSVWAARQARSPARRGDPVASVCESSPGDQLQSAAFDKRLLEAAEREGFATLGGPLAS